jgi:hypothetical protein
VDRDAAAHLGVHADAEYADRQDPEQRRPESRSDLGVGHDVADVDEAADRGVGLVSFKVPVKAGTTPIFELQRGGAAVQTVKSATAIRTTVPALSALIMNLWSWFTACRTP